MPKELTRHSRIQSADLRAAGPSIDKLLHTRDAAKILGVSQAWLERQRWKGEEPTYVRVGGQNGRAVRYRRSDLEAYIERNLVCPGKSADY